MERATKGDWGGIYSGIRKNEPVYMIKGEYAEVKLMGNHNHESPCDAWCGGPDYYLEVTTGAGIQGYIGLTEDQMLELFAAFLDVRANIPRREDT